MRKIYLEPDVHNRLMDVALGNNLIISQVIEKLLELYTSGDDIIGKPSRPSAPREFATAMGRIFEIRGDKDE